MLSRQATGGGSRPRALIMRYREDVSTTTSWVVRVVTMIVAVGAWQVVGSALGGTSAGLPGPAEVAREFGVVLQEAHTWESIRQTLVAWALTFALSVAGGVALGSLLGASVTADRLLRPTFDFLRAIPPIALFPLGVLILGVGQKFSVSVGVLVSIWPVLLQTMYGVRAVERGILDLGVLLRMKRGQRLLLLRLPASVTFIATGVRLTAVISLLVAVAVELLSAVPGVGHEIYAAQYGGSFTRMYAFVVVATILGAIIGVLFSWLERRALRRYGGMVGGV